MKAGFIGLGTMGASMAANLQKGIQKDGHTVMVHDVRKEAAGPHIKNGATWADLPAAIAAECEVILPRCRARWSSTLSRSAPTGCCPRFARKRLTSTSQQTRQPRYARQRRSTAGKVRICSTRRSAAARAARPRANWRSGAAATRMYLKNGTPCWRPSAIRRATSARSAPAR